MFPVETREFMLYYAAFTVVAVIFFIRRRPRRGMRLRMGGGAGDRRSATSARVEGAVPPTTKGYSDLAREFKEKLSHVQPRGERPLNIMFNYNGETWDAYEVLGLPAGSSPEAVEAAFRVSLDRVDSSSRAFIEAAYQAIRSEWNAFRAAGGG